MSIIDLNLGRTVAQNISIEVPADKITNHKEHTNNEIDPSVLTRIAISKDFSDKIVSYLRQCDNDYKDKFIGFVLKYFDDIPVLAYVKLDDYLDALDCSIDIETIYVDFDTTLPKELVGLIYETFNEEIARNLFIDALGEYPDIKIKIVPHEIQRMD